MFQQDNLPVKKDGDNASSSKVINTSRWRSNANLTNPDIRQFTWTAATGPAAKSLRHSRAGAGLFHKMKRHHA